MPRHVLLGVTGSIAAYRAADVIEALKRARYRVTVIMTQAAKAFVAPLTFQALTESPVYSELFHDQTPRGVVHIELADAADVLLIAPATAQIMAKLAHGFADDLLSCVALATRAPIIIAPAMNVHMYHHPAVQQNVRLLRKQRCRFVEPATGPLACGYEGMGHIAETRKIVEAVTRATPRRRR